MSAVSMVSDASFLSAIDQAHKIDLSTFLLNDGPVLDHLAAAAKNGADVNVTMAGDAFVRMTAALRDPIAHATTVLQNAGAHVAFNRGDQHPQQTLHAKVALLDDHTAYVNERNWPNAMDTIVRLTSAGDLNVVRQTIAQHDASNAHFTSLKSKALAMEADVITNAPGHAIDVETESFSKTAVSDAMAARADAGDSVRLIMVGSDLVAGGASDTALRDLAGHGVAIRLNPEFGGEKMALGEGSGWLGSANATAGRANQLDWGMPTKDATMIGQLRSHFEQTWTASTPFELAATGG